MDDRWIFHGRFSTPFEVYLFNRLSYLLSYFKKMTRLAQYGIYHISGGGEDEESFVGSPWYHSPWRLLLLIANARK